MGWLFGRKKKVPKVPFPVGHSTNEQALQFPVTSPSRDRIIEPEEMKEAAGLDLPALPPMEPIEEMAAKNIPSKPIAPKSALTMPQDRMAPIYIHVEVYRQILTEMDNLKHDVSELHTANKKLESSEYNEENNFMKLRRNIKALHDKLLNVDKIIFKT
jgi:hypothetical protein